HAGVGVADGAHGTRKPWSFPSQGTAIPRPAWRVRKEPGFRFARRGGAPEHPYKDGRGFAYEPGLDHPLLIPTAGDARPHWTLDDLKAAVLQARAGRIAVLQFHGVPDTAHDWVSTRTEQVEAFLQYLADDRFTVIALRAVARYVDPGVVPADPFGVIEDRKRLIQQKKDGSNARPARDDDELRYWLENALVYHRFTPAEAGAAPGLTADEGGAAPPAAGGAPARRAPGERRGPPPG